MEPEELEPSRLVDWHVVEVGRRQAWPFVNLADPQSGREVRLYIDATFSVLPGWTAVEQHDEAVLPALESISGLTITEVEAVDDYLELRLDKVRLRVSGVGNHLTSHTPWWVGATTG